MIDSRGFTHVTPEEFVSNVFSMGKVVRLSEKWHRIDAPFVRELINAFYHHVVDQGSDFDAMEGRGFSLFVEKMTPRLTDRGIPQRYVKNILDTVLDDARLEVSRLARAAELRTLEMA